MMVIIVAMVMVVVMRRMAAMVTDGEVFGHRVFNQRSGEHLPCTVADHDQVDAVERPGLIQALAHGNIGMCAGALAPAELHRCAEHRIDHVGLVEQGQQVIDGDVKGDTGPFGATAKAEHLQAAPDDGWVIKRVAIAIPGPPTLQPVGIADGGTGPAHRAWGDWCWCWCWCCCCCCCW